MKRITVFSLVLSMISSGIAFAQSGSMGMGGMDMKNMDMQGMSMNKPTSGTTYDAVGIVKKIDRDNGMVTFAHGPVKGLGWTAMTMSFSVEDKALLDKLVLDKKFSFKFVKRGDNYVVTEIK